MKDVTSTLYRLTQLPGIPNIAFDDIEIEPSYVRTIAISPDECADRKSFVEQKARDRRTDETRRPS